MGKIFYKRFLRLYKYKLLNPYEINLLWLNKIKDGGVLGEWVKVERGFLKIKEGYAWDGASGPTIDTKNFMRGSLVHDALYQLMSNGIIPLKFRKKADMELRRICIKDGMSQFRAWYVYLAVRLFARKYAKPSNREIKILTAP